MDLMDAIYTRRAVRDYKDTPLDDQTLRKLIDAAVQAPSAINEQPWSFCVVRDKALLAQTSREARRMCSNPHRLACCRTTSSSC
jgi:nitroreductase